MPTMYQSTEFVYAGGLLAYGTSQRAAYERLAVYLDRILRGGRPADLPIEQITKVDVVVNLKSANALGLSIPPDVAAQVTEWVQ
jgi:putative tryptophan/tyrosine transport system substrate-binding protein